MPDWVRRHFMGEDNRNRSDDYATRYLLGSWDAVPAKVSDERLIELQYPKEAHATADEVVSMAYELWNRRDKEAKAHA